MDPAAAQLQAVDDVREDAPDAWAEDDLPGVEHHATEGAQVVAQRLAQGTDAVLGLERVGGLPPGPVPVPQVDHRIVRTPRHGQVDRPGELPRFLAGPHPGRGRTVLEKLPGTLADAGAAALRGGDEPQPAQGLVGLDDAGARDTMALGESPGGG